MNANRFFSVPYDNRNDVKMLQVRKLLGGYAGYGRWVALLGILYDSHGFLDMSDSVMREIVADELDLDDVDGFFTVLAQIGLIDRVLYETANHVVSHGVAEEIEYKKQRKETGKMGGRPPKKQGKKVSKKVDV